MLTMRDLLFFLAGVELFHTLSHVVMAFSVKFPWKIKTMTVTRSINRWAIVLNGIVTIALLWAAAILVH